MVVYTQQPMIRLDVLPVEIIHRILTLGPLTNVLKLLLVNKSLRNSITTNPVVFQYIVESESERYEDSASNEPQSARARKWWISRGFDRKQDWSTCARWALADLKMLKTFRSKNKADNVTITTGGGGSVLFFLPELITQKHYVATPRRGGSSFAETLYSHEFWDGQFGEGGGDQVELVTRAVFVYTYGCTLLPRNAWEVVSQLSITDMRQYPNQSAKYLAPALERVVGAFFQDLKYGGLVWSSCCALAFADIDSLQLDANGFRLYRLRCLTLATLMVGIMHGRLKLLVDDRNRTGRGRTESRYGVRPPLGIDVPLESLLPEMLPPFISSSDKTSPFALRHLSVMTSSHFLTDGEWIGYSNQLSGQRIPFWGGMMHGMSFAIVDDGFEHIAVSSGGEDELGSYTLSGTIDRTTGQVQMIKAYAIPELDRQWSGYMTAFGIVGANIGEARLGWFWLWKRAWSR